eukprot:TRINITY_DN338_c0_g2_i1.p2 TRINITY_DN338_c0_g2~~TRINITY_DN338_c0_g2_i1.p2  ORF type:complete len:436 (-),score=125.04 TRINITY_DN338_c0_g2_i1:183-1400(-)
MELRKGTCDLERPSGSGTSFIVMSVLRYLIMLDLYGGIAGVIVGINTYTPPHEDDLMKLPPPAPAVMCTMILACVFFLTQLVIAVANTYAEYLNRAPGKLVEVMHAAADTASFAPMLSILFLACRMRALQHDAQPLPWAQDCMFAATGALVLTVAMAVVVPIVAGGEMVIDSKTNQVTFVLPNPKLAYVMIGLRYLTLVCTHGGCVGVMAGIFSFKNPNGPTVPVSPTVQCVVNLCLQYFAIYLLLNIMQTYSEVNPTYKIEQCRWFSAVESAKATVAIAPMLAILFVTTRMYALLITDKKGAPQRWVQDGMFMATWSLMILFLMCLLLGAVTGKVETDEDGNVVNNFKNKGVHITITAIRYFNMLLLYGGVITVIYGLFVMTPETANGRGAGIPIAPGPPTPPS